MISDSFLPNLPILLETKPELFSPAVLQDLLQTLAPLENNPPDNAEQILREWCKSQGLRDELRNLSENYKPELNKVKPSEPKDAKRPTNFFQELSQQVQDKLEQLEQQNQNKNKQ